MDTDEHEAGADLKTVDEARGGRSSTSKIDEVNAVEQIEDGARGATRPTDEMGIGESVQSEGVVDRQDVTKGKRHGGKASKKA